MARRSTGNTNLLDLIERAARIRISRGDIASQRGSFAIGSAALENSTLTRSSIAAISTEAEPQNARELEIANLGVLYDFAVSNVEQTLRTSERRLNLTPALIQEAHGIGLEQIAHDAGRYRTTATVVVGSDHVSPKPDEIPHLVDEYCDYINRKWGSASALHLAAYALWRLLWIHPFADGNGRVARTLSYIILSVKLGTVLPGTPTLPALIAQNRDDYYLALEAADKAYKLGSINVDRVEAFLLRLLELQLNNIAALPEDAEARLEAAIENRILRISSELRLKIYGSLEPEHQLWSRGAYLTLQVSDYESLMQARVRQGLYGDPFPGLLSPRKSEATTVFENEPNLHFLSGVRLHRGEGGALYLPPDVGLILSSVHFSDQTNQYFTPGTLYCIRLGPRTTIENCDELLDLLIARHIKVMS